MSALLKDYLDKKVMLVNVDGDTYYGEMKGFDHAGNMILLKDNKLCIIRSSEVVLCGLIDDIPEEKELAKLQKFPACKNKLLLKEEIDIWSERWANR
ncbi:Lsm8 [Kluyveromyces lactis]|nr:Lsm8 [Kluyveromyces lactis]